MQNINHVLLKKFCRYLSENPGEPNNVNIASIKQKSSFT